MKTEGATLTVKPWKQFVLVNAVAIFGIGCSLFMVPNNTPVRVWAAISGCVIAIPNIVVYRRLNRSGVSVLSSIVPVVGLAILIAEGGWQQIVAYVAIAACALTGLVVWCVKRVSVNE